MFKEIANGDAHEDITNTIIQQQEFQLKTDPEQDDRATELKLWKFGQPHMRGFHLSWLGFFVSFFMWFAIAPLQTEVKKTLKLTKQQLWNASIVGVSGTVVCRFLIGPLIDKYGPRIAMVIVLVIAAIPTGLTGVIQTGHGLVVLRLFIGISGSCFVACQYWCSRMFAKEVVGTANAIAAGWGNLGGGITQVVMGSVLFPLFKWFYRSYNEKERATLAWRTVCIVPAFFAFCTAAFVYVNGVDCPRGNYADLKKKGIMAEVSAASSLRSGAFNFNTWLLAFQYACCFGVELTMYNAAALYYTDKFGKDTTAAAAIASIFGWFNVFSRGTGGFLSDVAMSKLGMRGRLMLQVFFC
jgi:NNP family nitrate/nitrite transporter-like MFS transporter